MASAPSAHLSPTPVRRRLGEILVELGIIDDDQLGRALSEQRERGIRLGEVLLELGMVRPRDLLRALANQFELDFVDLDEVIVDQALAGRVPEALARHHRAIPVGLDDEGNVIVAMANPVNVFALDDLRTILRMPVRAAMADPGQIDDIIARSLHGDEQIRGAIRVALDGATVEDEPVQSAVRVNERAADDDAPVVRLVDLIVKKAVQERASDIHIEPTERDLRVRFRVDGMLTEVLHPPRQLQTALLSRIKVMADIDIAEKRLPQDGRITMDLGDKRLIDIRVATVPTVHGESAVLRILRRDSHSATFADLGLLPETQARFEDCYRQPWGSVFVAGPTGSGKTTTLYGALRDLNEPTRNIITIEDPVEYRLEGIKQVQVNNKAGLTFANALRNFLRADPDVILVGEVRDKETAEIGIEASLTGHLVLSSVHTNDASSTPMRLLEMGVEPFLVTSSLRGVLAQRLLRRLCDRCRMPRSIDAGEASIRRIPLDLRNAVGGFDFFHPVGCPSCAGSGFRGRFSVQEVLVMSPELATLILQRANANAVEELACAQGMVPMRIDGLRKVALGWTSLEELERMVG
ncbi:MAG: GspE/PulE family protein [Acidimicrobiia bacterium]